MKPYKKENISTAKMLRKSMTPYERKLWYEFLKSYPVRFQRQKCLGAYIADFYCAKAQLVLELDGNGHCTDEQQEYDKTRTRAIEELGIQVVRITNLEISKRFLGVCSMIDRLVKEKLGSIVQADSPSVNCIDTSLDRGRLAEALCDKYERKDYSKKK